MTLAWQARICDAHDRVRGAGFLLPGRRVLTCAHVAATAARPLRVYFPARPDLEALEVTVIDSESWYGDQDRRGDVALLHLPADPPLPEPASLDSVECAVGMEVRAFGFPAGHERDGHWAVATVVGPGGPGQEWYEIHGLNVTGGRIEKGFSGAALVNDDDAVVGMVVANDKKPETKIAWLIPLPVITRYHPSLLATEDRRPWRVRDFRNPVKLGVHRAANPGDGTVHTGLPPYVRRDAEAELDKAFRAGGLVVIQGPSAAGKSRLAFETMHRLAPDRRLVVPGKTPDWYSKRSALRDAVVWLDNVERAIVTGQLTEDAVDELCPKGRSDVVLLATLRAEARNDLRGTDGDLAPTAARLLNHCATIISLDRALSTAERADAEQFRDDPRVADALDQPSRIGFAEHIAAGPAAVEGWRAARQGENVTAGAIISAAVDARRAGFLSPLPRALLEELHLLYLGRHLHDPHRPPFSEGLLWTLKPVCGATGYLTAEADDRYSPFDYLVDHTQSTHPLATIPTDAMVNLGAFLEDTDRFEEAEDWYRQAADTGHIKAMYKLGNLLKGAGRLEEVERWYRQAAAGGHTKAMYNLGVLLKEAGRLEEAEDWYRQAAAAGHTAAMVNFGNLLKETGRLEEAEEWYRQAAATGHIDAMNNLGVLFNEAGRLEEAERWYRQAAATGHIDAMVNLLNLLEKAGRVEEVAGWVRWFEGARGWQG